MSNDLPTQGVGSLSTLLKRLEAATSRLEDIAIAQAPPSGGTHAGALPQITSPATFVPEYNNNTSSSSGAAATAPAASAETPAVRGFQELLTTSLAKYVGFSKEVGGVIAQQAQHVQEAFEAQHAFIQLAAACVKPPALTPALLGPTQTALMAVVEVKENNRSSKDINLLNTVSEGIGALGWVTLPSKPGPYVNDIKDSAQFYANRVVKDNKESNPKAVECVRSFIALLDDLKKYIMQYHTTELTWNPKGVDSKSYTFSSIPAPSAGTPPPPPPPPPAPSALPPPLKASSGDMGGVFAALNKGESVTSGLKKVDKSEMTHKNPELRAGGVVAAAGVGAVAATVGRTTPQKPPKPSSFQKKPPKIELDGNKWNIENHENNQTIVIDQTEINQIINIFNVKSSVIQIKGKVNAVSLVNCVKTSILLDSTVSSLAISTSPSFTVQILGKVPTILIDGTDGGQVYLSKESLDVEIITAKSSSINISLPVEGEEEGIFEEKAVPEQFKTVVKGGKLVTSVVEHSG